MSATGSGELGAVGGTAATASRRHRLLYCGTLLTCALLASAGGQSRAGLRLEKYLDVERVADPQISPDGSRLIYTRSFIDRVGDRWQSELWIMRADGSENRFLLKGSSPQWSPDSRQVAYLGQDEGGNTQIFVRQLASAADSQITRVTSPPDTLSWSPDGASIAFTMLVEEDGGREEWSVELPGRPQGAEWTAPPEIVDRLVYRLDRIGFTRPGSHHVFVVTAEGGTPRRLTTGGGDHGGGFGFGGHLSWTPDGREIVYSTFNSQEWEYPWRSAEVHAIEVETGKSRQLTDRDGPDQHPIVSPDGRWVAYSGYDWSDDSYIVSQLYVMAIDGSGSSSLTAGLDRSPYSSPYASPPPPHLWAPDSSGIYFPINDRGSRQLYFASIDGEVRRLTTQDHVLSPSSVSGKGKIAATLADRQRPSDIALYDTSTDRLEVLTAVNSDVLSEVQLGDVEEVWYESPDGLDIQGWIVTPPDFDPGRKYPLMLSIHGGPHAMYNSSFDFAFQEHAANGYVVFYANPRGSTGYGAAFGNAIKNAYPGKDFDDLMAGVDLLVGRGFIDERNLFVYGCSGGGVLTGWTVGHTDRFAAASANCMVSDWLSFVGTTDGISFYYNFAKLPWEDPEEHLRRSPLMYVENVVTPTMVMTGELDLNTPIPQAEQFYRALRLRGVPTVMIRFKEEWHGTTSRPSNFMRTQLYLRHWFQKHRRGGQ